MFGYKMLHSAAAPNNLFTQHLTACSYIQQIDVFFLFHCAARFHILHRAFNKAGHFTRHSGQCISLSDPQIYVLFTQASACIHKPLHGRLLTKCSRCVWFTTRLLDFNYTRPILSMLHSCIKFSQVISYASAHCAV